MEAKGAPGIGSTAVEAVCVVLSTSVLACEPTSLEPRGDGLPTGPDAVIGRLVNERGGPLAAKTVGIDGALAFTDENGVFAFDSVASEYTLAVDLVANPLHVFAGLTSRRPTIRVRLSDPDSLGNVTVSLAPGEPRTQIVVVGQTTQESRDGVVVLPHVYAPPREPADVESLFAWGPKAPAEFTLAALEYGFDSTSAHVGSSYRTGSEFATWYRPVAFTRFATTTLTLEPGGTASWVPDFAPVGNREVSILTPRPDGAWPDEQLVYVRLPGADQLTVLNDNPYGEAIPLAIPDIPGADFFLLSQTSTPPAYQGSSCATLVPIPSDAETMELVQGAPPELVSPEDGAIIGAGGELVTGITGLHTVRIAGSHNGQVLEIHTEQPSIVLPELSDFYWTWDSDVDFFWQAIVDTPVTELESMAIPALPHDSIARETSLANETGETCQSDWRLFRIAAP